MKQVADSLLSLIEQISPLLNTLAEPGVSEKPAPGKWSKKEILGHLIDSACNNQQKFVRTGLYGKHSTEFTGYEQDDWVAAQQYNRYGWPELIAFWVAFNHHLAHLIRQADPETLENKLYINGHGPYTLRFMMTDYIEHLKHHLKQILPDAGLTSNFSMAAYS